MCALKKNRKLFIKTDIMWMDGVITVYLSLILVIVMAILSTTVESARLAGLRLRCQSCAQLAIESLFADFYSPLLKEYGILALDTYYGTDDPKAYEKHLQEYVENNLYPNKGMWVTGMNLFPAKLENVRPVRKTLITEFAAYGLEEQIVKSSSVDIGAEIVEWLLDRGDQVKEMKAVSNLFKKIEELEPAARKVDNAVKNMAGYIEQLKGYDFREELETAKDLVKRWRDALDEEEEDGSNHAARLLKKLKSQISDMEKEQKRLLKTTQMALKEKDSYMYYTKKVTEELDRMKGDLQADLENMGEEVRNSLETQIKEVEQFSGGKGDYYLVERKGDILKQNEQILADSIERLSDIMDNKSAAIRILKECEELWKEYEGNDLFLNFQSNKVSEDKSSILERIKEIANGGILSLVANDIEISDAELMMNSFPSHDCKEDMEWEVDGYGIHQGFFRAILVDEYILNYFSRATKERKSHASSYEAEYILHGKKTDRENLEETIDDLLLIREGANLITLLGDAKKSEEAMAIASAMVGWSSMYGLVKVTQLIVLAVWAFGEALVDVHTLLHGGKVPLHKKGKDFTLSLEGLISLAEGNMPTVNKKQDGLSYEWYLRILLSGMNRVERIYRCMDLMQETIQKNENEGFLMKNCIIALKAEVIFKADPLFLNLRPIKTEFGTPSAYEITEKTVYKY